MSTSRVSRFSTPNSTELPTSTNRFRHPFTAYPKFPLAVEGHEHLAKADEDVGLCKADSTPAEGTRLIRRAEQCRQEHAAEPSETRPRTTVQETDRTNRRLHHRRVRIQQRQVHRQRHVRPRRVPEHVGVDVRAVRRHRVRGGQHGPDAVRRGQGRAGHDAPAPGRGRPAGPARTVRGQQGGRAGRVRSVRPGRRAQAARAHGTGPPVAAGQHGRGGRARSAGRRRAVRRHGVAGGVGQVQPTAITRVPQLPFAVKFLCRLQSDVLNNVVRFRFFYY